MLLGLTHVVLCAVMNGHGILECQFCGWIVNGVVEWLMMRDAGCGFCLNPCADSSWRLDLLAVLGGDGGGNGGLACHVILCVRLEM